MNGNQKSKWEIKKEGMGNHPPVKKVQRVQADSSLKEKTQLVKKQNYYGKLQFSFGSGKAFRGLVQKPLCHQMSCELLKGFLLLL